MHELMTHINTANGRIVMTLEASTILIVSKAKELIEENIDSILEVSKRECTNLDLIEDLNEVQRLLSESLADLVKYESRTAANIPIANRKLRVIVIRELTEISSSELADIKEVITNNHLYGIYVIAGSRVAPDRIVTEMFQSKLVLLTTPEDSLTTLGQPYACLNFRRDRAVFKCEVAGINSILVGV